jgi:acyl-CoA thioester hydrolase
MSARQERLSRDAFRLFRPIPTRWHDNDVFGHVNNVVYYGWFDTAVNAWLVESGFLDPQTSVVVGLVVETSCTYFESVAFPEAVEIGLGVERLGSSSVTYRLGIFPSRRQARGGAGALHPCLCRARDAAAGADPGRAAGCARSACELNARAHMAGMRCLRP